MCYLLFQIIFPGAAQHITVYLYLCICNI